MSSKISCRVSDITCRAVDEAMTIVLPAILALVVGVQSQCGYPRCGGGGGGGYQLPYSQHLAQPQPLPQPLPPVLQPQSVDYYYKPANTYAQPPTEVLPSVDKDITTATISAKSGDYEDIDKKLVELKTSAPEEPAPVIENPTVAPASTYIRETPVYQPYQPYVPRQLPQMPYRPQPLPQAGCGPMVPQYYRPAPYMPRGYVLPYTPTPTYAPPPPPPPPPPPHSYPGYVPPPRYQTPVNDCCGRCSSVCGHGARRIFAKSAKTLRVNGLESKSPTSKDELKDRRCTSSELKEIMNKISFRTPSLAKRLIQRVAEEKLGGFFSVFCSKDDFTYVSRGKTYCQTENNDVVCYAFQHH
ncbi:hypothetical protein Y032_0041g371 [Ancylostoma ceylanicum]|uniref:Ground-like domain-containing protein n=1 Tax=Ancylostoma ceylanicum TaxID=53326 RepID=A0A016UHS9_9BILA|nr:hypothetical protein Y032_0041g371 [Ancylostoma ceylanicum]